MHAAAYDYIAEHIPDRVGDVLEFGSRNINGGIRGLVRGSRFVGVDMIDGDGVDIVTDAGTVKVPGTRKFDLVVCAEVLEHAPNDECAAMIANAYRHLRKGGVLLITAAGRGREPHSAMDGGPLHGDEFYRNVTEPALEGWLSAAGFEVFEFDHAGPDIRARAVK